MPLWTKDVAAYLLVGTGTSALLFTAVTPGTGGNAITVTIVVSGDNTALSASNSGNNITINLATNASGVATSTVNSVIACVNSAAGVDSLVVASKGCVGAGLGLVGALTQTSLANGANQTAPNYVDSFAAADGWRSNLTGELLVAIAEDKPNVDLIGSGATVQNAIVRDNFFGRGTPYHYYDQGTQPAAADVIELLVEFNQAVKLGGSGTPTIPISVGTNTTVLSLMQPLSFDQTQGYGSLLFGYTVQNSDSATAGNVHIGSSAVAASHAFGSSNSEVTFTAVTPGTAGNSIQIKLNAPVSVNVATLSSGISGSQITYNLVTSGAVAATLSEGSTNSEITFTANTAGTAGNSITVASVVSGDNTPLTIGVTSNAITINVATNGGGSATSTITQVIAAILASGPASALITATTTGNGTGVIGAFSATNLATGANASPTTTVALLRSFISTDPNSTSITTTTTGNGTGTVAGVGFTSLSGGSNASATITLNGATIKNASDGTNAVLTLTPPPTSNIMVN